MTDAVDEAGSRYELYMKAGKSKFMVVSNDATGQVNLRVRGQDIDHFRCLGIWLNEKVKPKEEIRY